MAKAPPVPGGRAGDVKELLDAVQPLLLDFIARADEADSRNATHSTATNGIAKPRENLLLQNIGPETLQSKLFPVQDASQQLPEAAKGKDGLLSIVAEMLKYSTNTWHQGFLDKLYHSTNPVGVAAELILAVLNTNVHVYKVSPALTVIERVTSRALAALFGLTGPNAGGIVQAGGSASNLTALVIARNSLFPQTKTEGYGSVAGKGFVVFTSAHGHYSFEKACQICGIGSRASRSVAVDPNTGCMLPQELERAILEAKEQGYTPLLVNGTAGTTVLGSYDPFDAIADICTRHKLWFHIDASWGGGVVFSERLRAEKLSGAHRADSIAFNPHKMLGVPIQCSFLLAQDLGTFWRSNTLPASYLFHSDNDNERDGDGQGKNASSEVWDLADLTLQCGRRGDALKLALGWIYYGRQGYAQQVEAAFGVAEHLGELVKQQNDRLVLVSQSPAPCLQVCFYSRPRRDQSRAAISQRTRRIVELLEDDEFLVDYASASSSTASDDQSPLLFLRAVVGLETTAATVERLVEAVTRLGRQLDEQEQV